MSNRNLLSLKLGLSDRQFSWCWHDAKDTRTTNPKSDPKSVVWFRHYELFKIGNLFQCSQFVCLLLVSKVVYSDQLLCAARQIHVVYSDQLLGATCHIHLYLITISRCFSTLEESFSNIISTFSVLSFRHSDPDSINPVLAKILFTALSRVRIATTYNIPFILWRVNFGK